MRSPLTWLVVALLIISLCASGCSQLLPSKPGPTPSVTRQQSGPIVVPTVPPRFGPPTMTWYLVSLHDGNATVPVIPNTTITAFFDGQGNVSGTAGCNQYRAPYSSGNENLTIGPPTTTRMYCESPSGVMAQETRYLAALQEARAYSVTDTLRLLDGTGAVVLTYSPVTNGTPVPAPLTVTTWYVRSFVDTAGRIHSPAGLTTIRLVFGEDGNLYGNAGCNNHYGPYRTTGQDSITIGEQQSTRIHCGIAGVMDLEESYLALLPKITRYSISGNTLRLSDAAGTETIDCGTTPV